MVAFEAAIPVGAPDRLALSGVTPNIGHVHCGPWSAMTGGGEADVVAAVAVPELLFVLPPLEQPHATTAIAPANARLVFILDANLVPSYLVGRVLRGRRPPAATVDPLIGDPIGVVTPTPEGARRAGGLRARHYRKRTCELSLADCFLLAAVGEGDHVATSDRAVLRVAGVERLGTIPIPG